MKKLILISLFSVVSSLTQAAPAIQDMLGNWQKSCQDIEGDYLVMQVLVEKKNAKISWTDSQIAFEDESCKSAYLKFERQYQPTLAGNNLDLALTDVSYTPLTAEVAEALNGISFCGFSNWQLNKRQSILDKTCEEVGSYSSGQKLYSIAKISEAKELFIGMPDEKFDGSTAEKRHLQFESTAYRKLK